MDLDWSRSGISSLKIAASQCQQNPQIILSVNVLWHCLICRAKWDQTLGVLMLMCAHDAVWWLWRTTSILFQKFPLSRQNPAHSCENGKSEKPISLYHQISRQPPSTAKKAFVSTLCCSVTDSSSLKALYFHDFTSSARPPQHLSQAL